MLLTAINESEINDFINDMYKSRICIFFIPRSIAIHLITLINTTKTRGEYVTVLYALLPLLLTNSTADLEC